MLHGGLAPDHYRRPSLLLYAGRQAWSLPWSAGASACATQGAMTPRAAPGTEWPGARHLTDTGLAVLWLPVIPTTRNWRWVAVKTAGAMGDSRGNPSIASAGKPASHHAGSATPHRLPHGTSARAWQYTGGPSWCRPGTARNRAAGLYWRLSRARLSTSPLAPATAETILLERHHPREVLRLFHRRLTRPVAAPADSSG